MEKTNKVATVVQGDLLTATGRVKAPVMKKYKEQVTQLLLSGRDYVVANDNSILLQIAQDKATGTPIYARVQISITAQDSFSVKGSVKKPTEKTNVPELAI